MLRLFVPKEEPPVKPESDAFLTTAVAALKLWSEILGTNDGRKLFTASTANIAPVQAPLAPTCLVYE